MKLSVIIPVYRVENTLRRCVESILRQEYTDYEIILVDDGSPDNSGKICDTFAENNHNISVIHKENGGLSDARNVGISAAKGEYITFVDSDDCIRENTLPELMKIIAEHPEYDILEYPVYVHYASPRQHILPFEECVYDNKERYWLQCKAYMHSYAWNKIYRAELFRHVRFPVNKVFEDMWTLPELLKRTSVVATTGKGLYYYYSNDKGITINANGEKLCQLLDAHIAVMDNMVRVPLDYFMHVVNIQLDVYKEIGVVKLRLYDLYTRGYSIGIIEKLKYAIIKTCGINNLCKLHKTVKKTLMMLV